MPRLSTTTIGTGDQSWLGSTHGIYNARTETVNTSAFTAATHYPNGYIASGTPVALVGGLLVPYDVTAGTTTGAGVLAGHLLTDQAVVGAGNFAAPVLDHGRVKTAKVPFANFVKPLAAKTTTTIVYI
jgi:hypothetical protein